MLVDTFSCPVEMPLCLQWRRYIDLLLDTSRGANSPQWPPFSGEYYIPRAIAD